MQTSNSTPPRPVSGTARWRGLPPAQHNLDGGTAWLSITTAAGVRSDFWVLRITEAGKVLGYRLTQFDSESGLLTGKNYDVDTSFGPGPEGWSCDCGDAVYRARYRKDGCCKHAKALSVALRRVN